MKIGRRKYEDSKMVLMYRERNVIVRVVDVVNRHFKGAYALMLTPLKKM